MDGVKEGHGNPMSEAIKQRYPDYADQISFSQFDVRSFSHWSHEGTKQKQPTQNDAKQSETKMLPVLPFSFCRASSFFAHPSLPPPAQGAELLAKEFNCTREELDKLALESHKRAAHATKNGYFKNEIVPLEGENKAGKVVLAADEGIRPKVTIEEYVRTAPAPVGQGRAGRNVS